jgi:hypothetical protein
METFDKVMPLKNKKNAATLNTDTLAAKPGPVESQEHRRRLMTLRPANPIPSNTIVADSATTPS